MAEAYREMNIRDDGVTLQKFSMARRRPGGLPGDWRMTDDDEKLSRHGAPEDASFIECGR